MIALARVIAIAAFAAGAMAGTALAASSDSAGASATGVAQPLTPEAIREMVSRLSDTEVRKLLIDQLDRNAARPAGKGEAGMGMLGTMGDNAGMWRGRVAEISAAAIALPITTASVFERLSAADGASSLIVIIAAMLVAGVLAELVWNRATRTWRTRHSDVRDEGFFADAFRRAIGLAIDFAALLAFAAAALATFLVMWKGAEVPRNFVLGLLSAMLLIRAAVLVARFLLAPSRPAARLLPLPDTTARVLVWYTGIIVALYALAVVLGHAYKANGADTATTDALLLAFGTAMFAATVLTIWIVRIPIATLIRGTGSGHLVRLLAELWPVAATAYVVAVFAGRVNEVVTGERGATGAGMLSLLVLVAVPIIDYALCRALAAAAAAPPREGSPSTTSLVKSYEPVLRRAIHIVVIAVGLLWIADLWRLNVFAMAEQSLGGRVASSLLGISLVLLLAYMLWEIARTAIDRRLATEQVVQDGDQKLPASRLRTLLPLLRATLLITICTMAVLSVLAALGVDILPLLAGASVVGVAIGFGSQTLVRDIVTGAFFLMDDAFRHGEYIEVGDAKGTVEKITVRSLFLRHHRGALNILPYGEIKRLRNTSRDWMVQVLEFRLALDTDLAKVKKILKQIGTELAADEEYGPALLNPLKSQGVMETDENALIVRAKYTARPGDTAWLIRRVAYERILKAFREQGVTFASRTVAVHVPPGADDDVRNQAAAAVIAQDAAAKR